VVGGQIEGVGGVARNTVVVPSHGVAMYDGVGGMAYRVWQGGKEWGKSGVGVWSIIPDKLLSGDLLHMGRGHWCYLHVQRLLS